MTRIIGLGPLIESRRGSRIDSAEGGRYLGYSPKQDILKSHECPGNRVRYSWEQDARARHPHFPTHLQQYHARLRKRVQGLAAGVVTVRAEQQRAYEIGLERTEEAVALLRVLGPWNVQPDVVSYCTVLGKEPAESTFQFILQDRALANSHESTPLDERDCLLDAGVLTRLRPFLDIVDRLLTSPTRTQFQQKLFDALLLYSRSSLARNRTDKLIYMLAPLESLLLRNDNEPIGDRVGRRMAFFLEQTAEGRAALITNVGVVYRARSAFLHHGATVDDFEALKTFMAHTWLFFLRALQNADQFQRLDDLLDAIDHVSLGGS